METIDSFLKTFDLERLDVVMIGLCALLFLALWSWLQKFLFEPYLSFFELREAKTSEARGLLDDKARELDLLRSEHQGRITAARVEAVAKKIAAIAVSKKKAAEILERAELEARAEIASARAELATEADRLRTEAQSSAYSMAESVIDKLRA